MKSCPDIDMTVDMPEVAVDMVASMAAVGKQTVWREEWIQRPLKCHTVGI